MLLALFAYAAWAAFGRVTAMDLWWLMSAGRYIVEHGTIPDHDVLSYTYPGAAWFNGEWLSQVVFFELYEHAGGGALVAFKTVVILATFSLTAWLAWRRSGSLVLAVIAAVLTACACRPFFDLRSQLLLFLNLVSLVAILDSYRRGGAVWLLALLPPLMIVWVNWHYSFLYGLGILLLYAVVEALKSRLGLPEQPMPRQRLVPLLTAVAIACAATLLNPYGIRALTEPFVILGSEAPWRAEIIEWMPPSLFEDDPLNMNPAMFGVLLGLNLLAGIAAAAGDRRRVDLTDSLLVAATAVMALSARRFIPVFSLVAAPFLARNAAVVWSRFAPGGAGAAELGTPRRALAAGAAASVAMALLLVYAVPEMRSTFAPGLFEGTVYADYFPRGATEFLRLNPLPARLFHPYTWGGYISFAAPGRQMFIDGRGHTVYPWAFYQESQTAERGEPGWSETLDRWGVSVIVWPSGFASGFVLDSLREFSEAKDWVRIYDDSHSAVFAHRERARDWVDAFRSSSLAYPGDVPGAQLFLAQTYIDAKRFGEARQVLAAARDRWPEARAAMEEAERGYGTLVQQDDSAQAWFGLGFYRQANGSTAEASKAFREALRRSLADPEAGYARSVLGSVPSASGS